MNGRRSVADAAIRAMLEERARRAREFDLEIDEIVAAAGPRATLGPLSAWTLPSRVALGAGAVAAVLVAVLLVAPPFARPAGESTLPPGTSEVASDRTSAPIPSRRAAAEPLRRLPAAEAGDLIRTAAGAQVGILIVVDGRLEPQRAATCPGPRTCVTVLADAGSGITVRPVGDIGPGPWDGSGPVEGALILRLTSVMENGSRVAQYVGRLTTPPTGGPAWFVQDVLDGAAHVEGAYAAVQGWLVRGPFHPCASDPRNPRVVYGCPTDDWLSESEFQPLQPDGSSIGPLAAIYLSSGSYDRWAPDPAAAGPDSRGVEPREGTYLFRLVSEGCGPNADCAPPPPRWRIVGRFDSP